jgi:hypothetical protein
VKKITNLNGTLNKKHVSGGKNYKENFKVTSALLRAYKFEISNTSVE